MKTSKDFYVYLHRKATTGEVFYVGKGTGRRAWSYRNHSPFWQHVVAKHGRRVEIVHAGVQEWWAFELEAALIAKLGRKDLGLGALVNLSDGGEGPSGRVVSAAERQVLREANLGKQSTFKGRTHKPESLAKQRAAKQGKKMSAGAVAKINASRVRVGVVSPCAGLVFDSFAEALRWLVAKGFAKAAYSSLRMACKGLILQSYGYTWRYATPEETAALKEKGASWAPLSELSSVA